MITQIWSGLTLDQIGLIAALIDAFALAGYFLIGDRLGKTKSSAAITTWGFGVASAMMFFVLPVWNFPTEVFSKNMELLGRFSDYTLPGWVLILWIVVMGTIAPYILVVSGLKILSASTASVFGMIEPVSKNILKNQLESVISDFKIDGIKIGMVYNSQIIKIIYQYLKKLKIPIVVDPVIKSTTGGMLIEKSAIVDFKKFIVPLATIITPNQFEAEILTKTKINSKIKFKSIKGKCNPD